MDAKSDLHSKRGGVADYFALVGVGEKLIWKHAQKKAAPGFEDLKDDEEDETALFERFQREIVDVALVTNENDPILTSISKESSYTDESSPISLTNTISHTTSNVSKSIPLPPQNPDAATSSDNQKTSTVSNDLPNFEGFTKVQSTCPTGRSSQRDQRFISSNGANEPSSLSEAQDGLIFDANLDPYSGFRRDVVTRLISRDSEHSFKDIGRKVGSTLRNQFGPFLSSRDRRHSRGSTGLTFHLAYRRRAPDENDRPAVASVDIRYVRLHRETIYTGKCNSTNTSRDIAQTKTAALKRGFATGANVAARVAEVGKQKLIEKYREHYDAGLLGSLLSEDKNDFYPKSSDIILVALKDLIDTPENYDQFSIPEDFRWIKIPGRSRTSTKLPLLSNAEGRRIHIFPYKTGDVQPFVNSLNDEALNLFKESGFGFESYFDGSSFLLSTPMSTIFTHDSVKIKTSLQFNSQVTTSDLDSQNKDEKITTKFDILDPSIYMPQIFHNDDLPYPSDASSSEPYVYIPILVLRRQSIGEQQRYFEDPALVEVAVTFSNLHGKPVLPDTNIDGEIEDDEDGFNLLSTSNWSFSGGGDEREPTTIRPYQNLGLPIVIYKKNRPLGFADVTFATSVLDRFPMKNYKGLPLPEEELPMFCYPTGCRLYRAKFNDCPLPQYFGFVVKNEQGDSIHVSCVSFMEPLCASKETQLDDISWRRRRTSLPHRQFCIRKEKCEATLTLQEGQALNQNYICSNDEDLIKGFDEMTTFEKKTICLISRYPFWTAFRRFLSHLHIMSVSPSELPVERYISHLLLNVPLPKPGGPSVLIPLPALNCPMILALPPSKDLPLLDLPFQHLFACLDVPTIITIVVGLLSLERKIIIVSSRPSLVLDVCELLKALIFPFDLCAPYVPRLTEPFVSCLDFPGAIFVGIFDDGTKTGLAATVRKNLPEDSFIVDLDTGKVDCSGNRYEVLKQSWMVIPSGPRSMLVSEIETLCRDSGIIPGQELLDSQVDLAFDASVPLSLLVEDFDDRGYTKQEPLDDRAVRDAFLRFFTNVLAGYERFLVPPDLDFKTSGSEWFDTQGFLSASSQERTPYLTQLVSTQLFQLFVQRRTEDSDIHCLLFDECLTEYHSSSVPYGRLGGDVEIIPSINDGPPKMVYSLLVDQCCAEPFQNFENSSEKIRASFSDDLQSFPKNGQDITESHDLYTNNYGDIITTPSRDDFQQKNRYVYVLDGNPCFPQKMNPNYFSPKEPDSILVDRSKAPIPLLGRSEREIEEAARRRRTAITYRGLNNQRRCLWQLPKLMGSHFLGTWLLCVPSQVSQQGLKRETKERFLQIALGATRLLRNKQRIIPDEASYRALIVACGYAASDCRVELSRLFGLLRSDGIFPSAVTLGQYTRALAEGYSKMANGSKEETTNIGDDVGNENEIIQLNKSRYLDEEIILGYLDGNISVLEESGRHWRSRISHAKGWKKGHHDPESRNNSPSTSGKEESSGKKKDYLRPWHPVLISSSFVPNFDNRQLRNKNIVDRLSLVAMCSRTTRCNGCSYIPLDEEIQSCWDVVHENLDHHLHSIACPRCGCFFTPKLGYKEFSLEEALHFSNEEHNRIYKEDQTSDILPPQLSTELINEGLHLIPYMNPESMRSCLEQYLEEYGESILEREKLRQLDPALFYNFWWYCARFSLPLPLPVSTSSQQCDTDDVRHTCVFAAWDSNTAERGCKGGAEVLMRALSNAEGSEGMLRTKMPLTDYSEKYSLLFPFKLQSISKNDWENNDLSQILVSLIEACDIRDFKPVVECALKCFIRRQKDIDSMIPRTESHMVEMDCYRTLLYLSKYQCTTAFHAFFPTATKPCKGYHFWCAFGTPLPIFDRLFRDAVQKIKKHDNYATPIHDVSDVALGFRCVFGHII